MSQAKKSLATLTTLNAGLSIHSQHDEHSRARKRNDWWNVCRCQWPLHFISYLLLRPMILTGMEAQEDHKQERRGASSAASAPNQIPRPTICFAVLCWPLAGFTAKHDV